ncbi:hypothetical protein N864_13370 [Intrasporangium chromatireducens Q5-1]|uniref:DUF2231 domain-containing protein n=1 Tax=Intrasporangium chromatireducens Q5-1 TaxID=584657 RepID=W9GHZ3_9MICO|nr:DUF2231 domain-containing protein [Intrasporangium chromatireducens]EWT04438.1 hypothetical protein N864_13370 [Intrasporangium chromatireducens Q5-1]
MPDTIGGLPVHPLVVHAVVVLVPLAVLLLVAALASATVRRRAGIVTPVLATVALALVPIATDSGEGLERRLPRTDLIRTHAELGDTLAPWMAGVALAACALWWFARPRRNADGAANTTDTPDKRPSSLPGGRRWFAIVAVVGVVAAVGTAVQIVRIGDSGARAVWQQTGSLQPASDSGHGID